MHRSNEITFGCILAFCGAGCSAITTWPDVNDKTQSGGASHRGGASSRGGNSASNAAGAAGIQGLGGASSGIGGLAHAGTSNSGTAGQSGNSTITSAGAAGLPTLGSSFADSTAQAGNAAGGAAGTANVAGGVAGTGAVTLTITTPTMPTGKTGVPYATSITATGATQYSWSIGSGSLPGGITLQNVTSASVSIAGTPTEAGLFPVQLSVTDGTATQSVDVMLAVTHKVAFLSDRTTPGVQELYMVEVGGERAVKPIGLSPQGGQLGVGNFAWSETGRNVAFMNSTATALYVASASEPVKTTDVASDVAGYKWLSGGDFLAYYTTTGAVSIADLSNGSPATRYAVPLPALEPTEYRIISQLTVSPRSREFALSYQVGVTGDSATPRFGLLFVSWPTSSTPIVTSLRETTGAGAPTSSFSYDGTVVATSSASGGLKLSNLSNANSIKTYDADSHNPRAYTWSRTTLGLLSEMAASRTALQWFQFAADSLQTVFLGQPTCTPVPGPWSPKGNNVLFGCGADLRAFAELSASSASTDFTLLPADFSINSFTNIANFDWSPNGEWIATLGDTNVDGLFDLYLIRWSSPGVATKPYASATAPGISAWQFGPNSRTVAYVGALGTAAVPELHLTTLPSTGTPTTTLALTATTAPAVQNDISWLPGSRVILYRASDLGGPQLHAVHVSEAGTTRSPLSVSGISGTGVMSYRIAPLPN